MSKSNGLETSWVALYFNATPIANIADNAASAPATNLYVSLHSADPGEAGSQTTNEITYTAPYARIAVARTSGGWTVSGNTWSNAALVQFAKSTGVADDVTAVYWGIGRAVSGAGTLDWSGPLASFLGVGTGATSDTITIPGLTGVAVGDKIIAVSAPTSTIPAGITEGTTYFVKTLSGNDITISTTSGGATLDITAAGAAFFCKLSPLRITQNVQPQFQIGTLTGSED